MKRRSSGTCHYCDRRVFPPGSPEVLADRTCLSTRDHVVPQIWGDTGVRTATNIVTACQGCNNVKGSWPAEIFEWFVRQALGTSHFTAAEFNRFAYGLAMAGFRAARRDALTRRPPLPSQVASPIGTYTARDLRKRRGRA